MSFSVSKYRSLKKIISGVSESQRKELKAVEEVVQEQLDDAERRHRKAEDGAESISKAARGSVQNIGDLTPLDEIESEMNRLSHAMDGGKNFVSVYAGISRGIRDGWSVLSTITSSLATDDIITTDDESETSRERMHDLSAEYQLNRDSCERFADACIALGSYQRNVLGMMQQIASVVEGYRSALAKRHSEAGIKVWHAPILTDFALTIYDNIAHHGEVSSTSTDTEISAYSMRRAESIIEWIKDDDFKDILLSETVAFTATLTDELWALWKAASRLRKTFSGQVDHTALLYHRRLPSASKGDFEYASSMLKDLDPNQVKFRDRSASLTEEERHELQFKNRVIGEICQMLKDDTSPGEISRGVWERVKELQEHYLTVNSFYICRIAQGNQESGKTNGQLEVIPGKKPNAKFDDIVGDGFGEVKEFVAHVRRLRKWGPLYLITSPRKQAPKSNILLIGPMGCGKTESMRAMCNEKDSIAIFASGSDFLTAWMGEAQKNPKRLFEAAVKIQKDSDKHVHILIDEIDEVMNNDRSTTTINLSLEFQILMDGVVEYPNITVWGATNNPERIPMAMIRRFSKVLIVGKLSQDHRVTLLKHFLSSMPLSDEFTDELWQGFAGRLEGATGDVVRKVCDHVWSAEISKFISDKPEEAERMLSILKKLSYDRKAGVVPDVFDPRKADEEIDEYSLGGETTSQRKKFLKSLKKEMEVQPGSLDAAIDIALSNLGIISEIETAKETYKNSESFLAAVRESKMEDSNEGDKSS